MDTTLAEEAILAKSQFVEADVAEWRSEPAREPLLSQRIRKVRWERPLAVVICVVASFAWLAVALDYSWGWATAICLLPAFYILDWAFSRRPTPSVEGLADEPNEIKQYPVSLALSKGRATYGTDSGVVSFVGPWLVFEGLRTSFSMSRASLHTGKARPISVEGGSVRIAIANDAARLGSGGSFRLVFNADGSLYRITFRPLQTLGKQRTGLCSSFATDIEQWAELPEEPIGRMTIPPLEPHQAQVDRLKRFRLLSTLCLPLPLALVSLATALHVMYPQVFHESNLELTAEVTVTVLYWFLPLLMWRAGTKRLRRLEVICEERQARKALAKPVAIALGDAAGQGSVDADLGYLARWRLRVHL